VAQEPAPGSAAGDPDAVVRIVRSLRDPEALARTDLDEELAAAAGARFDLLFDLLAERVVPALAEEDAPQQLSVYQRDLLLDTLRLAGSAATRPALDAWLGERPGPERRAAAIRVLGATEDPGALETAIALAARRDGEPDADPGALEALRAAAAELLVRDAEAWRTLEAGWRDLAPETVPPLVQAAGDARDPRALPFLAAVVGWRPELAELATAQFRRVGPPLSLAVAQESARRLRPNLDPRDRSLCRSTCLALGELGDLESVPSLIELLALDDVRSNAAWALTRITGQRLPPETEAWSAWLAREEAWYDREMQGLARRLRSRHEDVVAGAVRETVAHPLFRHELSTALCELLFHPRRNLRLLTCRALADLGSTVAVESLIECLPGSDREVAAAAQRALEAITGMELGDEPDAWIAVL